MEIRIDEDLVMIHESVSEVDRAGFDWLFYYTHCNDSDTVHLLKQSRLYLAGSSRDTFVDKEIMDVKPVTW